MKIIITGGAGFIGSHCVELLLEKDHEVLVLDNFSTGRLSNLESVLEKIQVHEMDLSIKGKWEDFFSEADAVIHLAALADIVPSIQSPSEYFKANVEGTLNVLEASRNAGVKKFIYAASSSCYGITETHPTKECSEIIPQYPYALTKRIGEELVMHWSEVYDMPAVSLRFFNVYGTRSRTSGTYGAVFGVFLAQKLAGKPFTIVGDGTQTRDFTSVKDVVRAIYMSLLSDCQGEIFNVGSGSCISINRIAELLKGPTINIPKRPGEPDCTFADISKIQTRLNWEPAISIEEGVQELLENIDYWKDAPVWNKDSIGQATKDWFKYLDK